MPLPSPYVSPDVLSGRALRRLAVVGDGQEPTADNSRVVLEEYAALHAEMTQAGEIEFPYEQIPQEAVDGMVGLLAARVAPDFGRASIAERPALIAMARRQFFSVNARPMSAAPARGEYF